MLDIGHFHGLKRAFASDYDKVIVTDEFKLIYVPIAKNSNSYIKSIFLYNVYGDYDPFYYTPISYQEKTGSHLFQSARSARSIDGYERIVVLRDPFKRFLSAFYDKVINKYPRRIDYIKEIKGANNSGGVTFKEFVDYMLRIPDWRRNHHFRSQSSYYQLLNNYGHIGRVENLDDTVSFLKSRGMRVFDGQGLHNGIFKKTGYEKKIDIDPSCLSVDEFSDLTTLPGSECFFETECHKKILEMYQEDYILLNSLGL